MAKDVFSNMAEEFQKYKDILDQEKKEFKKQLLKGGEYLLVLFK